MNNEEYNPDFDINAKYESMIKTAIEIVKYHSDNNCEPPSYISLACDVKNYLPKLQKENQELKNQLENCYCNRTDCSSRIKNSKKYDSLVQKVENQQKEFIDFIESSIKDFEEEEKYIRLDKGYDGLGNVLYNCDIKAIVTKERFENGIYVVGD